MPATSDELVAINLPMGPDGSRQTVLAVLVDEKPESTRVLLSDLSQFECTRTLIGSTFTNDYRIKRQGHLSAFLLVNSNETQEILIAGGAAHGQLTLARAVKELITGKGLVSPSQALQIAIDTARRCHEWNQELARKLQQTLDGLS